ncbi:MAG TPA: hypothetical protein VFG30_38625, partial [Polyangiales bacterium]|nr:hypothetical protein [Polyangiales bacterium]
LKPASPLLLKLVTPLLLKPVTPLLLKLVTPLVLKPVTPLLLKLASPRMLKPVPGPVPPRMLKHVRVAPLLLKPAPLRPRVPLPVWEWGVFGSRLAHRAAESALRSTSEAPAST